MTTKHTAGRGVVGPATGSWEGLSNFKFNGTDLNLYFIFRREELGKDILLNEAVQRRTQRVHLPPFDKSLRRTANDKTLGDPEQRPAAGIVGNEAKRSDYSPFRQVRRLDSRAHQTYKGSTLINSPDDALKATLKRPR